MVPWNVASPDSTEAAVTRTSLCDEALAACPSESSRNFHGAANLLIDHYGVIPRPRIYATVSSTRCMAVSGMVPTGLPSSRFGSTATS